ncbi:hypothetical protein KXV85_004676, partial [Aspergillus fumigatus]
MVAGITAALTHADDPAIKAVVLMGTGRAFCAGADLKYVNSATQGDAPAATRFLDAVLDMMARLETCPRPVIAGGPGDQHLRLGEQQRAQPIGLRRQLVDLGAQLGFVGGRARPVAHQKDRRDHREAEQRHRGGENGKLLVAESEPVGDGIGNRGVGSSGDSRRQQRRKDESDQAVAR